MNRSLLYGMGIGVVVMAVAVLLLGGTLVGPRPTPPPTSRPSTSPRPTNLPTFRPSPTPLDTSIKATAVVVPQRSADLSLPISGIVDTLFVHELDTVTGGQLLVRLNQSTYLAAIDTAQSDLNLAEEGLTNAQLQVAQLPPDATPE